MQPANDSPSETGSATGEEATSFPLGVSRPPLSLRDLPEPEVVFDRPRIGPAQVARYVLGPSVIALGGAVGSGEWLLGPLAAANSGFAGVFFIITISAALQAGFNYECARYITATGEPSIAGFMRTPPGWLLWLPLSAGMLWLAHIFGGWALAAGQSVFTAVTQQTPASGTEQAVTKIITIGLLALCGAVILATKRISRVLERISMFLIAFTLLLLLVLDIIYVGLDTWLDALGSFVTPALPGGGLSATALGALAGYAGATAGLNWFILGHYRDKGYGMGHYTGYLGGLRAKRSRIAGIGVTFPETSDNARRWRRWRTYLRLEMWGIFLPFALLGMLLPSLLMVELAERSGVPVTQENVATYLAIQAGELLHPALGPIIGLVGAFVFLSTLLVIFEGIPRATVDGANASTSPRLTRMVETDPRRLYIPVLVLLGVVIAVFINLAVPTTLIQITGNLATLGMILFPPALFFLNRRLPKPARIGVLGTLVLLANFCYFGTFFVNFVVQQVTGAPLFTL